MEYFSENIKASPISVYGPKFNIELEHHDIWHINIRTAFPIIENIIIPIDN